jgi:Glycosyl hydrolase family 9
VQNAQVQYLEPGVRDGVETYAAVSAAFAALSIALRTWDEELQLAGPLAAHARQTFDAMLNMDASYAAAYPDIAASWPSDGGALADDKLLAAAFMLLATGEPQYRRALLALPRRAIRCHGRFTVTHAQVDRLVSWRATSG